MVWVLGFSVEGSDGRFVWVWGLGFGRPVSFGVCFSFWGVRCFLFRVSFLGFSFLGVVSRFDFRTLGLEFGLTVRRSWWAENSPS